MTSEPNVQPQADIGADASGFTPENIATMGRWAVESGQLTQAQVDGTAPISAQAIFAPPDRPNPVALGETLPADVDARLAANGLTPAADPAHYDLPVLDGGEYSEATQAFEKNARGWMSCSRLSVEHGSAIASAAGEIAPKWQAMSAADQTLYTETSRAQLARAGIGPEQLALASRLVRAVEAQRPGLGKYLEATGAGSHPMIVSILVQHARLIYGEGTP